MAQNFLSKLEKELGDKTLSIKLTKAPSYISCFLPLDEIILIHKVETNKNIFKNAAEECTEISELSENDVTGHPLEVPLTTGNVTASIVEQFDFYEIFEEKGHVPLKLSQARHCLNIYNLSKLPHAYPIWVLIDGDNPQKLVLLSSFKSNGWIKRCWATDKGATAEIPPLERLQQIHARLTCAQDPPISCQVKSTYVIKNRSCEHYPQEFYSCTTLQATWNSFKVNPPLNRSTEVILVTKCKVGEGSGGLLFLWRQLQLIHQYVEIILERSRNNCADNNIILPSCTSYLESFSETHREEIPLKRISKVLREPIRGRSNITGNATLSKIIELFTSSGRPGMDITDKLWYIFIECTSYQELSACFKQLFIELKKMGTSSPFVSSSNISCLANCLLGQGGANILDPLEYLVEVGLDKLKKEILFIFSKAQIATLNSLNVPKLPKFSEISTSDWMSSVQKWLQWFSQIHCVLELIWNTQEAIVFPNDSLLTLASTALNIYTGPNSKIISFEWLVENRLQEIKTNVPVSLVERRLGNEPHQWVLTLSTKLDGRNVESIFYKGLQSPFAHILGENELPNITITPSLNEEANYYWAELFSVSDEIET
ncbi:zwilch kinetochore protein [Rhodnius prolixus]|uniref:zwilch kinetochore protein n=1 Tax=Rhodnius prolixus TaxID=13249 RepID=UPI003D18BA13